MVKPVYVALVLSIALLLFAIVNAVGAKDPPRVHVEPDEPVTRTISTERGARAGMVTWKATLPATGDNTYLLTSLIEYHDVAMKRWGDAYLHATYKWIVGGELWLEWKHETQYYYGYEPSGLPVARQEIRQDLGPIGNDQAFVYSSEVPTTFELRWDWTLTTDSRGADVDATIEHSVPVVSMKTNGASCNSPFCANTFLGVSVVFVVGSVAWWRWIR